MVIALLAAVLAAPVAHAEPVAPEPVVARGKRAKIEAIERIDALADEVVDRYGRGEYAAALAPAKGAVALAEAVLGPRDRRRGTAYNNLGGVYEALAEFEEAEAWYRRAFAIRDVRRMKSVDQLVELITTVNNIGSVRRNLGDVGDALEWFQTAWQLLVDNQLTTPVRLVVGSNLAQAAGATGDDDTALTLFQWVLASHLQEQGETSVAVADARARLGRFLVERGHTAEGRAVLEAAVAGFELNGHAGVVEPLADLAHLDLAVGDAAAARGRLDRVLDAKRSALGPGHPDVAIAKANLANAVYEQESLDEAAALYAEAIAGLEAVLGADHVALAPVLANLAAVRLDQGRFAEAEALVTRSIALVPAAAEGDLVQPLFTLARIHQATGDLGQAQAQLRRAVDLAEARYGAENPVLIELLVGWGWLEQTAGDIAAADAAYARALAVATAAFGDAGFRVGGVLNAHGAALLERDDFVAATAVLRRALATQEAAIGPDDRRLAPVVSNLAIALQGSGDLVEARRAYARALAIERAAYGPDHPDVASTLHSLGGCLFEQGDVHGARSVLEEALALKERALGPHHASVALTLTILAQADLHLGAVEQAKTRIRTALAVQEAALGPTHPDLSPTLIVFAEIARKTGDLALGRIALDRAREVSVPLGPLSVGEVTLIRAQLELDAGELTTARDLYEGWLAEIGPRLAPQDVRVAQALWGLAAAVWLAGETARATELTERSLALFEQSQAAVLPTLSERERLALVRQHRIAVGMLLTTARGANVGRAYEALLRWKGIASRSLAAERRGARESSDPEVAALLVQLRGVRSELAAASYGGGDVAALTGRKEHLERDLAARSAAFRSERPDVTPAAVCGVLPAGATLVDAVRYDEVMLVDGDVVHEPVYAAFVMVGGRCDRVERVDLGAAEAVDRLVERFRGSLADGAAPASVLRAGTRVRARVWDPIARVAGPSPLVFVAADGSLTKLPLAALPVSKSRFLIEDRSIVYLSMAQDLLGEPGATGTGVLVVGGIDYGPSEAAAADPGPVAARGGACATAFDRLPGTAAEAAEIAAMWGEGALRLSGREATEGAVAAAASGRRVVHLATHGFFAGSACASGLAAEVGLNPMLLSGVALAGANTGADGAGGDGIWTAEEIAGLRLDGVGLVVLSACETGLGEIADGEGVLGLQRGFRMAGAESLITSLWAVEDDATQRLMADLHRHLDDGAAVALRTAQLAMLAANRGAGDARPDTWGAFVVSGPLGSGS